VGRRSVTQSLPSDSDLRADVDPRLAAFKPVRLRKAADEVVSVIVDAIRGGLYEPGEKLPREVDLAARLEVSRTTVREAVGAIQRAGIVTVRRGRKGGAVVVTRSIPPDVLAAIEGESNANMRSLLETRRILEVASARLAAQRGTERDFLDLEGLVEMLEGLLREPEEFIAADVLFHIRVAEASGNTYLARYTRATLHQFSTVRVRYPIGRIDLRRGIENQRRTLDAIKSRNVKQIEAAIDDHLGSVEEHFLGERLSHSRRSLRRTK
jgi:GntR family transcriptional regulator, transcriptional repressor for pyruvate dehydrogenase complex